MFTNVEESKSGGEEIKQAAVEKFKAIPLKCSLVGGAIGATVGAVIGLGIGAGIGGGLGIAAGAAIGK